MTANHTPDARRIPDPVALRRSVAGRAVRLVYGALMLVLAAILGWFMVKPLIYVSGPGTSIAPKKVISLPFVSRVSEVHVTPGEIVDAGTLVATVESPEAEM